MLNTACLLSKLFRFISINLSKLFKSAFRRFCVQRTFKDRSGNTNIQCTNSKY